MVIFSGFKADLVSFLLELRFNNNKAFMQSRREDYLRLVRDPFYAFIETLAPGMRGIDPFLETKPHKCLSRIYRDTRFSRDKSPYRDHHWVAFRRMGEDRQGSLFFWFELRIESVGWGMGLWGENRPLLDAFRTRMTARPEALLKQLPALKEGGFSLEGAVYPRMAVPKGLPPALKAWYPRRELYLERGDAGSGAAFESGLCDRVLGDFQILAPVYRLLRGEENEWAGGREV